HRDSDHEWVRIGATDPDRDNAQEADDDERGDDCQQHKVKSHLALRPRARLALGLRDYNAKVAWRSRMSPDHVPRSRTESTLGARTQRPEERVKCRIRKWAVGACGHIGHADARGHGMTA